MEVSNSGFHIGWISNIFALLICDATPGADLEGGREPDPPPWNFQIIHLGEQHFQRYQRVFLHAHLKTFRLASLAYYHIYLCKFRHYRSTILQIALEIPRSCIVHKLSTLILLPSKTPISVKVSKYRCCLQRIFKIGNFLHFFKIYCIIIPSIFNLSFKERDSLSY